MSIVKLSGYYFIVLRGYYMDKKRYCYITEKERYLIEFMLNVKHYSIRRVSIELKRDYSTVYREVQKGLVVQRKTDLSEVRIYKADYANKVVLENMSNRGRELKLKRNCDFLKFVERSIVKEKFSPQASIYKYSKNNSSGAPVCVGTLYNYIYKGNVLNVKPKNLPYRRKKIVKREINSKVSLNNRFGKSIDERNKDVLSRSDFGHWEMDTVMSGRGSTSCLLVLTERKSRIEVVSKIKHKSIECVVKELDRIERKIGNSFSTVFKTITCDNGCEFLDADGIVLSSSGTARTELYYCHPYRSSERGSNENQNKLVRRKYPKGFRFSRLSKLDVVELQHFINNYPRKLFQGRSALDICLSSLDNPIYNSFKKEILLI